MKHDDQCERIDNDPAYLYVRHPCRCELRALRSQLESAERDRDAAIDLLRRIRASINTNSELSALCMQDIDAMLEEK